MLPHRMLWLNLRAQSPTWLKNNDVPSDILNEFSIDKNSVSVYKIDSNKSNLDVVLTSLASNRKNLRRFDYFLLDLKILSKRGWQLLKIDGETPNTFVNQNYHYDVIELSGKNIVTFGDQIVKKSTIASVAPKDIKSMINASINNGSISKHDLKDSLVKRL